MVTKSPDKCRLPRHHAWRDQVLKTRLNRSERRLALDVLARVADAHGVVTTGGWERLAALYRRVGERGQCSRQLLQRLVSRLVDAGLIEAHEAPAPGRPASYRLTVVQAVRRMIVRPRGIAPRRIHRQFRKELDYFRETKSWNSA